MRNFLFLALVGLFLILSGCGVVKGIATQTCRALEPNRLLCPNMLDRLVEEAPPAPVTTPAASACKKVTSFALRGRGKGVVTRSEGLCVRERKLMQWKARRAGPGVKCEWRLGRVECASALPTALSGLIMMLMGWVRKAGLVLVDLVGALVALITMRGRRENVVWHKRQESMSGIEEWVDIAILKKERLEGELADLEERLDRLYVAWEDCYNFGNKIERVSALEFNLHQLHILEISARTVTLLVEMGHEINPMVESQVYSWAASYDWEPQTIWEALKTIKVGSGYAESRKETRKVLEREVRAERALPQPWDDTTIV